MAGKPFLHKPLTPLLFSYHQIINEWIIYHLFSPMRFDLALSLAFQGQGVDDTKTLSRHVQRALRARWHGYLPPGSCLVASLPSASDVEGTCAGVSDGNPFGASCIAVLPTMRYPVNVRWHQDLVYNAVWSLLVEVGRWNTEMGVRNSTPAHDGIETMTTRRTIKRVLMTGLGTGYGQISVARCAQQMILAIKHFAQGGVQEYADWGNVDSLIKEVDDTLELWNKVMFHIYYENHFHDI
jgi:hypothetical protein